jgi:uncharacterized coiled-coil protein SlyX
MASLVEILAALDELPAIVSIIRRLEGQMAETQEVIAQLNNITNRMSTTVTAMAGDTRTVADRLAALQGAITSGNQDAVRAAMDSLAPELGRFTGLGDQLDAVGAALRTMASDPNNPTEIGVPLETFTTEQVADSGGDVEAGSDGGGSAPDSAPTAGNPSARGVAADDAAPGATTGANAEPGTGNPAAPDVTGPTDTAVGGAADATEGTAAGMPTGGTVDTSGAGGGVGSESAEGPGGTGPTVGAPNTAP